MRKMLKVLAAIFAAVVMAIPMVACGDSSKTQSELDLLKETIEELTDRLDDLTAENGELNDRLDDLTTENGELTDKIEALNVFTSDKAEYGVRETMTVYFKNIPVLKIRLDDPAIAGAGKTIWNGALLITSFCADLYADSIMGNSYVVCNSGIFLIMEQSYVQVLEQNKESRVIYNYQGTAEAYTNATSLDLVICVPGTPFELARFKNIPFTK